jgi:hypothetical protein
MLDLLRYSPLLELKDCIHVSLAQPYLHVSLSVEICHVLVHSNRHGGRRVPAVQDDASMMIHCFSLINLRSLLYMLLHNFRS